MVSWVVQDKAGLVFPFWVTASTLIFVTKHLLPLTALHSPTLSVCRAPKEEGWVCQPPGHQWEPPHHPPDPGLSQGQKRPCREG